MEKYTFRGGPEEAGRAQGALDPEYARRELEKRLNQHQDLEDSYFRENMSFMKREFPELVAQMEAYGEAAGIENFDHTFLLHVYFTAADLDGCSALGIMLKNDGPAMLRTYDTSSASRVEDFVKDKILMRLPDSRPRGLVGIGERFGTTVGTAINDAGLLVGSASGHRKFNPGANPEHVNLYFTAHLLAQYCSDCDDVRHFLRQYRISGIKGLTGVAVDAAGDMVGFELESDEHRPSGTGRRDGHRDQPLAGPRPSETVPGGRSGLVGEHLVLQLPEPDPVPRLSPGCIRKNAHRKRTHRFFVRRACAGQDSAEPGNQYWRLVHDPRDLYDVAGTGNCASTGTRWRRTGLRK